MRSTASSTTARSTPHDSSVSLTNRRARDGAVRSAGSSIDGTRKIYRCGTFRRGRCLGCPPRAAPMLDRVGASIVRVVPEPVGGPSARSPAQRWATFAALLLIIAVVLADLTLPADVVLAPAVLAGPFLVATVDDGKRTAIIGAIALAGATVSVFAQDLAA